jgi:hypothetical protein
MTTPVYPLEIDGDTQVGLKYTGHDAMYASIYVNAANAASRPAFGYMRGSLRAMTLFDVDDYFKIRIDGANHLVISPAGNLGLGAASPSERLHIDGALRLGTTANNNTGTIRWTGSDFEGYNGSSWLSLTGAGSGSLPPGVYGQTLRHDGSDWNPTSNLYNNGISIGIGTTSPEEDVHLFKTGTVEMRIQTASTNGRSDLMLKTTGGTSDHLKLTKYAPSAVGTTAGGSIPLANLSELQGGSTTGPMLINVLSSNPIHFATNNYERMRIASDGLVGINTTAPDANLHVGGSVKIGTTSVSGTLDMYNTGSSDPALSLETNSSGGELYLYDELSNITTGLYGDGSGDGAGYFYIKRDPTYTAFRVDGNYNGSGSPVVSIFGNSATAAFDMGTVGNNSVMLPSSSISSTEILDEPGVASQIYGGVSIALTGSIDILLSRSISVPGNGYVLAIGTVCAWTSHSNGTTTYGYFGVSDNSGTMPDNQTLTLQISSAANSGVYYDPITVHGLFSVSAGVRNFYILADEQGGNINVSDMQLSLVYIPTSYGTVVPTIATGRPSLHEEEPAGTLPTAADIERERAESIAADMARIERELAEIRAQFEALNVSDREDK